MKSFMTLLVTVLALGVVAASLSACDLSQTLEAAHNPMSDEFWEEEDADEKDAQAQSRRSTPTSNPGGVARNVPSGGGHY